MIAKLSLSAAFVISDRPGATFRPGQHSICLGITDEPFFCRVPFQGAVQPVRYIADMAYGNGPASNFRLGGSQSTCTNAFQEVVLVVFALVKMDFVGGQFLSQ